MCKFEPLETAKGYCGKCDDGILKPVIGKREKALCNAHYWESKRTPLPKSTVELKRTPIVKDPSYVIPKVSPQQKKRNSQYSKQRGPYLLANSKCVVRWEGCEIEASTIHHGIGRIGDRLTDESGFIACCLPCHQKLELNPDRAKEEGFSFNRL